MTNEMLNAVESKEMRKSLEHQELQQLKKREIDVLHRIRIAEDELKQKKIRQ